MTPARIREAATKLREAADECPAGPWRSRNVPEGYSYEVEAKSRLRVADDCSEADAEYIAMVNPVFGFAVAAVLDGIAAQCEDLGGAHFRQTSALVEVILAAGGPR